MKTLKYYTWSKKAKRRNLLEDEGLIPGRLYFDYYQDIYDKGKRQIQSLDLYMPEKDENEKIMFRHIKIETNSKASFGSSYGVKEAEIDTMQKKSYADGMFRDPEILEIFSNVFAVYKKPVKFDLASFHDGCRSGDFAIDPYSDLKEIFNRLKSS